MPIIIKSKNKKGVTIDKRIKLFGVNGISDKVINKLQSYFYKAIRDNKNDLEGMRNQIKSIYLHHSDPEKRNNHRFCPKGSWCYFKNKKIKKKTLCPPECIVAIKSVFEDLSGDILEGCLPGLTQNINEGVNQQFAIRFNKTTFARLSSLRWAVADTVICFNDGYFSRCKVIESMGFSAGRYMEYGLEKQDKKAYLDSHRQQIKRSKANKVKKFNPVEVDYIPGNFD